LPDSRHGNTIFIIGRLLKLERLVDDPFDKTAGWAIWHRIGTQYTDGIYGSRNLNRRVGVKEILVVGSGVENFVLGEPRITNFRRNQGNPEY